MKSALLAAPLSGGRSHSRSGPGHSNLFCVARRPVFDIDPATHGEGLRVDDLKVPESQTAGGPIAETLLDPVFRNMEAAIRAALQPQTKNRRTMRHCVSGGGCWSRIGICDGKETMFPRTARRRDAQPGLTGAFSPASLPQFEAFQFLSIETQGEV
jgi:hypothetical protein